MLRAGAVVAPFSSNFSIPIRRRWRPLRQAERAWRRFLRLMRRAPRSTASELVRRSIARPFSGRCCDARRRISLLRIGASRDCNQSYWRQQRCAYLWKTASSGAGVCYVEAARITPRHSGARICAEHSMPASRAYRANNGRRRLPQTGCVWSAMWADAATLKLRRQGMSASTSPFTRSKVSSERCSLVSRPECGRRCGPRARVYLGASAGWLWRARAVKVVRAAWVTEAAYCVYLPPSSFTIAR